AVAERAGQGHEAREQEHRVDEPGRAELARHLGGREEDPDADDLPDDQAGGGHETEGPGRGGAQNWNRNPSWNARGPPDPKTPPAVVTALPKLDEVRKPGLAGSLLSRASTFA